MNRQSTHPTLFSLEEVIFFFVSRILVHPVHQKPTVGLHVQHKNTEKKMKNKDIHRNMPL